MSQHTPTPWTLANQSPELPVLIVKEWEYATSFGSHGERHNRIPGPMVMADYRGGHIAMLGEQANAEAKETAHANAAFIVRAVNSHAALVAVVKQMETLTGSGEKYWALLTEARAAINLAGEA